MCYAPSKLKIIRALINKMSARQSAIRNIVRRINSVWICAKREKGSSGKEGESNEGPS